jgi:hypothetical protein
VLLSALDIGDRQLWNWWANRGAILFFVFIGTPVGKKLCAKTTQASNRTLPEAGKPHRSRPAC